MSKHFYLSTGFGFRPNTYRKHYVENKYFQESDSANSYWALVLFFSQGTLIWKERERKELFLKKQFLGYFQSHKCFCYFWQQQNEEAHSMGRRCSSTETAPSVQAVAPRRADECFVSRHCLPPAKAGQAGQALSKCWKVWSYVKKKSKKHIWTLFQWLDLPRGEASKWLFPAKPFAPFLGCTCLLYWCPVS